MWGTQTFCFLVYNPIVHYGYLPTITPSEILVWLVVWNMNFIFPYIGNVIIPIDELIFFRGVGSITNQYIKLDTSPTSFQKLRLDLYNVGHPNVLFSGL